VFASSYQSTGKYEFNIFTATWNSFEQVQLRVGGQPASGSGSGSR